MSKKLYKSRGKQILIMILLYIIANTNRLSLARQRLEVGPTHCEGQCCGNQQCSIRIDDGGVVETAPFHPTTVVNRNRPGIFSEF